MWYGSIELQQSGVAEKKVLKLTLKFRDGDTKGAWQNALKKRVATYNADMGSAKRSVRIGFLFGNKLTKLTDAVTQEALAPGDALDFMLDYMVSRVAPPKPKTLPTSTNVPAMASV